MLIAHGVIRTRAWAISALTLFASLGAAGSASGLFKSDGIYYFQSPSRNINCEGHRAAVYCTIYSRVEDVTFKRNGRFTIAPMDANPSWKARILSYGKSVTFYGFRCSSLRRGMRCVRRSTGHGVLMSRSGVRRV